jgi:transcriptional regulator with XRE-family HTH domain
MKPHEFRAIRNNLGLSEARFAELLGYTGLPRNNQTRIREYERGKKQVPLYIARLAWLCEQLAENRPIDLDKEGVIVFPSWPGYDFESVPDRDVSDVGDR